MSILYRYTYLWKGVISKFLSGNLQDLRIPAEIMVYTKSNITSNMPHCEEVPELQNKMKFLSAVPMPTEVGKLYFVYYNNNNNNSLFFLAELRVFGLFFHSTRLNEINILTIKWEQILIAYCENYNIRFKEKNSNLDSNPGLQIPSLALYQSCQPSSIASVDLDFSLEIQISPSTRCVLWHCLPHVDQLANKLCLFI